MEKIKFEPTLAVICPFVNLYEYINKMVASIRTKEPYLLVMIDNNSDKKNRFYLDYLKKREDCIYVENDMNLGVAASWNLGIIKALEYPSIKNFLIANNDIIFHPECINSLVENIEDPRYSLVSSLDVAKECETPSSIFVLPNEMKPYEVDEPDFSCFMINRDTWNKIGAFDEKFYPAYFEDNDYHYRIRLAGTRGVKTSTALHYHYGSRTIKDNPDMESVSNAMYLQNQDYYVMKWGGKPGKEKYKTPYNK